MRPGSTFLRSSGAFEPPIFDQPVFSATKEVGGLLDELALKRGKQIETELHRPIVI